MLGSYAFIGILLLAALIFPVLPLVMASFLRPKRPALLKNSTYECGIEVVGDIRVQFKAQYYIYALAFVIFSVETVFLYPWAVVYGKLGLFALLEMIVFVLLLLGGLAYAWRKGALEWQ